MNPQQTPSSSPDSDSNLANLPLAPRHDATDGAEPSRGRKDAQAGHKEGEYVVDFYSILGVAKEATEQEIRTRFNELAKRVHPDRLKGTEFEEQGKQRLALFVEAKDTLIDPVKRAEYDALLESFPEHLRSKDGIPILSFSSEVINLSDLIGPGIDIDWKEIHKMIPGPNPVMLKVVQQAHKADPTPETEEALREALLCELTAAMIADDVSWRNVGVNGAAETKKLLLRPEQILEHRKEQIEAVRARVPELVQNHLLGGGTDVPLLPASSQIDTASEVVLSTDPQAVAIQIRTATDTALAKFEEKAGELIAAAERRVNVTDQLIQLTSWQYLGSESPKYPKLIVLMMIKDKVVMGVDCSLNDGAIDLSPIGDFDGIKRQDLLSDTFAATCRSLNEQLEANIAVVEHYSEVAIEFEITHVVDSHFATFLHSEAAPDIEN